MGNRKPIDVTIVGGGMITHDLLLPSLYHLQRLGIVNDIAVCALNTPPLQTLEESPEIRQAFPEHDFTAHPSLDEPATADFPDLYKDVLAQMPPYNAVVVAVPDQLHHPLVMEAMNNNQHVLCVKPLVLKYDEAVEIERVSRDKGLFIGIEYHKRFDRRSLLARKHYRQGDFGEFVVGDARLFEPYLYRTSNFQNWFTCDQTDPFVYIGCHYVDLVCFITGLRPAALSVSGVKGRFPNGNEGYMWANGRVIFENGAVFSVLNGLGYPDDGAGPNDQCLMMMCEGEGKSGLITHNDQFRGVSHGYLEGIGAGGTAFNYINPDFFRLVPWQGDGLKPIGYGYDSVEAITGVIHRIVNETDGMAEPSALAQRQAIIDEVDKKGLIATPANSSVNELVMEAARLSILEDGAMVDMVYGDRPHVELRR